MVFHSGEGSGEKKRKATVLYGRGKGAPVSVHIFDENKKPVQADIQRTARVDVEQLYEEAKDPGKTGFFAEITGFSGKVMYLVFECKGKKSVYVVHLQNR